MKGSGKGIGVSLAEIDSMQSQAHVKICIARTGNKDTLAICWKRQRLAREITIEKIKGAGG